jgi:class 3 adenylate cyclase
MSWQGELITEWWSRFSPRSWSIAVKLSLLLVFAALIPMIVTAYYNYRRSYQYVRSTELIHIEYSAYSIAGRIEQRIQDTANIIKLLTTDPDTIGFVSRPTPVLHLLVTDMMRRVQETNSHFHLLMIVDKDGTVIASTREDGYIGKNLKWRDYFKAAIQGQSYMSSVEVGSISGQPGIYISAPIRNHQGLISGVAVVKLNENAISSITNQLQQEGKGQAAFVIDKHGIVIFHRDPKALYHSLDKLPDDILQTLITEKRFMRDNIPSANLPLLAKNMIGATRPGHLSYRSADAKLDKVVGFAPVKGSQQWVVGVSESQTLFLAPLHQLFKNVIMSVSFVGIAFVLVAMVSAQSVTRPLRAISDSIAVLEKGDFDNAHARLFNNDEIGQVARAFNTMVVNMKEREREKDIFGRVVSPEVREKLLAGDLTLGGENRRVTVLFSDIRNFTTLSEKLGPDDLILTLNDYLTEMSSAVRPFGGYINNFIGDAIVVIFGAPVALEHAEWSAVQAGMAMLERLEKLNSRRAAQSDEPLKIGVGISTGKAIAGQIGSPERFLYTVIGDAINVAARLETLTKEYKDCPILMNDATYEAIKDTAGMTFVSLGPQHLKGRTMPVEVYGIDHG